MDVIGENTFILVYRDRRRKWIVRPSDTPRLHTHLGILDCKALVGESFGITAKTSLNDELVILKPTIEDMILKLTRRTQVIYPKDLGMIMVKCGIHSGSMVLESGTGSGATTALLAYLVMPSGHVFSYEVREDFQENARKNLARLGLLEFVTLRLSDAKEGFQEKDADAGILDIGDPWEALPSFRRSLRPSGVIAAVTPTTNQAERLVEKMKEERFVAVETIEILVRHLEARSGMTRPSNAMIGHTAYLTFGRKTL
ncbi:MAG TPA: tRNA (adenine-N1)-methyltransferase [Nitrososphaerales archaeon]|nr:tRNA (adenine-N1)-methyltransferase [Nitrososphaerales archaeon]